jgi:hypothetical protein
MGDERPDQAPLASGGQPHGMIDVVVRQHCADRTERLDDVRLGGFRDVATEQHRREERTADRVGPLNAERVGVTDDEFRGPPQRR